jgi:aspartate aminotransferase
MNRNLELNVLKEQMLITTGASEALIFTFMTCCDPGDDVLIFDPTYANYMGFAAISGVRLVSVITKLKHGFALPTVDQIAEKFTNRTRVLLLCNPNNPTGTLYSREELQMLLDLCNERNIFLVVDETYREIIYDGKKPLSIFHLDPNNQRLIVIDSLSKRFSLCGARLGCLITKNEEVLAKALSQAQARLSCASIEQFAAAHMLANISDVYLEKVRQTYENRRDVLYDGLCSIPGVEAVKPEGAFYTLVRLPFRDAENFASFLLSDFSHNGNTVFSAPAGGFYMQGDAGNDKIRLGFVLKEDDLRAAVEAFGAGIEAYQRR